MDVTAGEKYQLLEPDWSKVIGQDEPPEGLTITRTDAEGTEHVREIGPWGEVVKASATCDPDGKIANMDASPPLVRTRVIEELSEQFEHVPTS
jgi:hypothetical protein